MLTTILPKADFFLVILLWSIKFTITAGDGSSQELLIKNITQILDLLLKDYDNSQHPNHRADSTLDAAHDIIRITEGAPSSM
ncbi:unnamed protein product [Allacma fusca]|uniref:Uncharacterized protein n=1 Tax=Allacma fusca TaxID=39272 RepID=A0A8J2KTM6_9HEXA|nr:unnamed protein product [Allacma fusca]